MVCELIQRVGIETCGGETGGLNALGEAAMGDHLEIMAVFAAAGVVDTSKALGEAAGGAKEASVRDFCCSNARIEPHPKKLRTSTTLPTASLAGRP